MDFGGMFQTWLNVLTKPGEAVFEEERQSENATYATTFIWIAIAAVIAAVFSVLASLVGGLVGGGASVLGPLMDQLPPEVGEQYAQFFALSAGTGAAALGTAFCLTFILTPIFFFVGSLIYFVIAKLLGGTGEFEEQSYLLATFYAPLLVVNSVIGIVPILGGCVSFFIWIYQLVLSYFALKVSHNLSSGRALAAVLIPLFVVILLFACCFGLIFFGIFASLADSGF